LEKSNRRAWSIRWQPFHNNTNQGGTKECGKGKASTSGGGFVYGFAGENDFIATAGTTLADFADRSLGIGYAGGASLLFLLLMTSLATWYWSLGSVSVNRISSPKAEMFYWITIMFSQTFGTALGDWTADSAGLG
jgi:hypothetical protein